MVAGRRAIGVCESFPFIEGRASGPASAEPEIRTMRPGILPVILRELVARQSLPREPEPDLVMDGPEQVAAYAHAGRIDGVMSSAYLFHTARITQVIRGCRRVVDLGCGPATQLCQVAQLNPDVGFLGIDLSREMLASARARIEELELTNIELREGDMTVLDGIADDSVDGVISTMALHHLPRMEDLDACFAGMRRVLKPGGALYLTDFGRLRSLKSVIYFAYMNAAHQPHIFTLDYERSLRAAFLASEIEGQARRHLGGEAEIYRTAPVGVLVIVKSADKPLDLGQRVRLAAMRNALARNYRQDLDLIRRLFRLGGLGQDPFGLGSKTVSAVP